MTDILIAIVPAAGVGARAAGAFAPVSASMSATMPEPASKPMSASTLAPAPSGGVPDAGAPKQYRLLRGEPMLRLAVRALLADTRISQVRVAVSADDVWAPAALRDLPRTVWRVCGGATRADTVSNALADSAVPDDTWVLVHDAARPGLPADALARLIDACLADPVGGLLALPVADTVKMAARPQGERDARHMPLDTADVNPRARRTLDRNGLWLAQTPQMFRAGMLREALAAAQAAGLPITDEASAIEAAGFTPRLVLGDPRNFKVTWPGDFLLSEKWL